AAIVRTADVRRGPSAAANRFHDAESGIVVLFIVGSSFHAKMTAQEGPMEAERTERLYSRLSSHYDLLFDKVFQPGREAALSAMELRPGERVLEIGVGTGLVLPLYPRNVEVIGIDLSEGMLEEARYRIAQLGLRHASVLRMDAADLEFEDGAFDAIL